MLEEGYRLPVDCDGKHTQYYENIPPLNAYTEIGKFREFVVYNTELCGPFLQYSPDGTLLVRAHFNEGKLDGKYDEYYETTDSQTKKISGEFIEGSPFKRFETYYESGNICTVTNFDANGMKHGDAYEFYDDHTAGKPQVKLHVKYSHGDKHGPVVKYSKNGKVVVRAIFENNLLSGEYTRLLPTGTIRVQCTFFKGRLHGKYLMNYPDGNLLRVMFFNMGRLDGQALFMHKDRRPKTTCEFSLGKLVGAYKTFGPDGKIASHKIYNQNMLVSVVIAPEV